MHARSIASRTTHRSKSRDICNMRWLIIDEISQVTAELLAQCEHNVQCMMQANGTYKNGPDGVRPWGGLNVLYVGDFQQVCINPRRKIIIIILIIKKFTTNVGVVLVLRVVSKVLGLCLAGI